MGSDISLQKVVVNTSSSHNYVIFLVFFYYCKVKEEIFCTWSPDHILFLERKIVLIWVYIYIYFNSSHEPVSTEFIHITKLNYFKLVLTKSFNLNSNILQNSNILFQANYSTFIPVAIHKIYKLCSCAYLYRQKGFEQGSIKGDLGIWGKFQFHMELVRRQLGGVKGKAGWSCGRRNHTLGCFLWRP